MNSKTLFPFHHKNDIYQAREKSQYDKPIPSREHIIKLLEHLTLPADINYIAYQLQINSSDDLKCLSYRLKAMVRDKQCQQIVLGYIANNQYKLTQVQGKVYYDTFERPRILVDNTHYRVLPNQQMLVMYDDDVECVLVYGLDKLNKDLSTAINALVINIIQRHTTHVVGKIKKVFDSCYLESISPYIKGDMILLPTDVESRTDFIEAKIVVHPTTIAPAVAAFESNININNNRDTYLKFIKSKYHLHLPPAEQTFIPQEQFLERVSLHHLPFITIDDISTQDVDDAIYADTSSNKIFIAIADVAHYVEMNSALDKQAFQRVSSMYFPGATVHMLPDQLAKDLCSLNAGKPKLVLVCEIDLDIHGNIICSSTYEASIVVKHRLSYEEVDRIIDDNTNTNLKTLLHRCYELAKILLKSKTCLSLNDTSAILYLNENGYIKDLKIKQGGPAQKIVASFMVAANRAVSEHLYARKIPAIFRSHDAPHPNSIKQLKIDLEEQNPELNITTPQDLYALSNSWQDRPTLLSRIMGLLKSAYYTTKPQPHFGLNCALYSHFTSPIRRYTDLITHRIIKADLRNTQVYTEQELEVIADICSKKSRYIDAAVAELNGFLKCIFANTLPEQRYTGIYYYSKGGRSMVYIDQLGLLGWTKTYDRKWEEGQRVCGQILNVNPLTCSIEVAVD